MEVRWANWLVVEYAVALEHCKEPALSLEPPNATNPRKARSCQLEMPV